jgi:hypothetical protein
MIVDNINLICAISSGLRASSLNVPWTIKYHISWTIPYAVDNQT